MPKMTVVVDKFPYGKTAYRKGAEVDIEDRYVELFLRSGKLRWPDGVSPNASDLPVEVMGRASKREPVTEDRHFDYISKLEPAEVEEETMATKVLKAEVVEKDEDPKPSAVMTYHRRDLVAEAPKVQPGPPKQRGRPGRPKKSQS